MIVLITGKAGAGKTTYANRLADELRGNGLTVEVLDSEVVRKQDNNNDYSMPGRARHLNRLAVKAAKIEQNDINSVVLVAAIAPTKVLRKMMRYYWLHNRLVYLPGGSLWEGTTYEIPGFDEF